MIGGNQLLLAFYGDDFTGSTDALESITRAGARSALFLEAPTPERLARYPGLQAVGVAGMTRAMTPPEMEAVLRPALAALRRLSVGHVHYKVCSTFDSSPRIGSIGRVIDLALELFGARFVPLVVAAPALGRYCVFGNLFARLGQEGEAFRLDRHPSMSRHPVTPADESDLRLHLARQTAAPIGLLDILQVGLPPAEARKALEAVLEQGAKVVLFDALSEEQLRGIGGLIDAYAAGQHPLFTVGSSGVETALGGHWNAEGRLTPRRSWPDPGRAEPLLVASGSCSPVTAGQIAWALAHGFAAIALDTVALAAEQDVAGIERKAAEETVGHLRAGRNVIVHTNRDGADPRVAATARVLAERGMHGPAARAFSGRLFGSTLGHVIREAVFRAGLRRLALAGGDTSGYAAQTLGLEALEMIAPITPGAPLCRACAPGSPVDGLEISFKGGQVGPPDFFEAVAVGRCSNAET